MNRVASADNSDAMSLFPFLAVLLCTMGALIVLLVVVAHQSRLQASQEAAMPPPEERVEISAAERIDEEKLTSQIAEIEQLRGDLAQRLKDDRRRLQHWEAHMRRLSEQLVQLEQQARQLQQVREGQLVDRNQAESEDVRLKQLIAQTRDDLEKARTKARSRPKSYSIIPYQGPNETYLRPIYIECLSDAVILQPEGIRLEEADFFEPLGPNNPLASALRAASEYYARENERSENKAKATDAKAIDDGEPYPLLLVRPEGVEFYYKARRAIASWDGQFGYEMIEHDWKLALPPPNPDLAAVEYRAIEESRALRRHLIRIALRRGLSLNGSAKPTRLRATNVSGGFRPEGTSIEEDWADEGFGSGSFTQRQAIEGRAAADNPYSRNDSSPRDSGNDSKRSGDAESRHDRNVENGLSADGQQAPDANGGTPGGSPVSSLAGERGKNWAVHTAKRSAGRGAVPITRSVYVACRSDRLVILATQRTDGENRSHDEPTGPGSHHVIPLPSQTADAVDTFMSALQDHIKSWGIAGKEMYWRPKLVLQIAPDGQRRAADVQALLRGSGLTVIRAPGGAP